MQVFFIYSTNLKKMLTFSFFYYIITSVLLKKSKKKVAHEVLEVPIVSSQVSFQTKLLDNSYNYYNDL